MYGRLTSYETPMNRLREEIDRLVENVFDAGWATRRSPTWSRTYPALNVWEDEDHLYAEAEVPGLTMEDLELFVRGDELTIRGERKSFAQEGVTAHRRERGVGEFSRVLRLPVEVDAENVEAQLNRGVLTITLPKAPSARPRKIEVKALNK